MVAPTFEQEILSDGGTVLRRFESGKLVSSFERHTFSSGRQMSRNYDSAHQLINEVHSYGILKIAINREYKDGKKSKRYFTIISGLLAVKLIVKHA